MRLSITTDYRSDRGNPRSVLERIARAGFTHVHWCQHWEGDYWYTPSEIRRIRGWLGQLDLSLLDLHASRGEEQNWSMPDEYCRSAGVELIANRLRMTAELGGRAIVLHAPIDGDIASQQRSLEALLPLAEELDVGVALENLVDGGFTRVAQLLHRFDSPALGFCYDSGHAAIAADTTDCTAAQVGRLLAVHLHDNDGVEDAHMLPLEGVVDWDAVLGILAALRYRGPLSLEVSMRRYGEMQEADFLARARTAGRALSNRWTALAGNPAG